MKRSFNVTNVPKPSTVPKTSRFGIIKVQSFKILNSDSVGLVKNDQNRNRSFFYTYCEEYRKN